MLDYDENMALLKVNRHLALFRIQHYNHLELQGIPLHRYKYSLLSCAELQYQFKVEHIFFKSGDWHVIPTLHGSTLT